MRVVTNEALINRNKQIAQYLLIASFAVLGVSLFLVKPATEASLAIPFQLVMMIVMIVIVTVSLRMTNNWTRLPLPWERIREGLKGIGSEAVLYNFVLPARHVLVTPNGIFAIVTRFQERPQKVIGDTWKPSGGIITYMRQESIGDPTQDAIKAAARVEEFLQGLLGDETIKVQPLIVFIHPRAKVEIEGEQTVPILYAEGDKKDKNTLKGYFKEVKKYNYPVLTKEQIAELDDALLYED